ncbi:MAG: 30S ribosomal protein S7 [Elusimicrobiota bacterium]|jgi:small subunit ribosomal protein S7|nr:30S ribosomal protein S7 [Elusimicrobiota bacterium]
MPRRKLKPKERRCLPDPDCRYSSVVVSRFINKLNFEGKKSVSESIIYSSFDVIRDKTKANPLEVFNKAIENIRPLLEVKSRRVGGATYQVPVEVPVVRSVTLAIDWLIEIARNKTGKPMYEKLAQELIDGSRKEGAAIKKREDTHKMAEANKAFVHYKW